MSHNLTTFIGAPRVLRHLPVAQLRLLTLPQGMALAPMPGPLLDAVRGERDMSNDEILDELAKVASLAGPIGWLISDWFGGSGGNEVALWEAGRLKRATQQEMFAALGVVRVPEQHDHSRLEEMLHRPGGGKERLLDEWDSLGLGHWRDTERAYEHAQPVTPEEGGGEGV